MRWSKNMQSQRHTYYRAIFGLWSLLALGALGSSDALAQAPGIVFTHTTGITGIGSTAGNPNSDYAGTAAHVAANSRGDIFVNVSINNGAYVEEIPANGTPQVALITGLGGTYGGHSLYVDSAGNVYVADTGDAQILYIPFVNGSYPVNISHGSLTNCSAFPVPATQTTTCVVPLNYPGSLGYYVQSADVALDGSGNLYVVDKYTGGGVATQVNKIVQFSTSNNATVLIDNLPNNVNAQLAVDKAGDIFYADGNTASYYAAGSSTAVPLGTGISGNPSGVSIDAGGNVILTDQGNNRLVEFPSSGGAVSIASQFTISGQLSSPYTSGPSNGVGLDGFGNIYYAGSYPNSLSSVIVGSLSFDATGVGTTTTAASLNVSFPTATTFGTFSVAGPAGAFAVKANSCTQGQSYAIGATCSVSVTYTATAAGPQSGQLLAYDDAGSLLGYARLAGSGAAAVLNVDPGTVSSIGSSWIAPSATAVDALGNIYVADSSTGKVYKTAAGSATQTAIASGFNAPTALAVDGGGSIYVGDSGNGQVVEVPYLPATNTYGAHEIVASGLKGTSGLAFDNAGNLYVADSGNARVLRLSSSGNQPLGTLVTSVGSGLTTPVAVAVDNAGGNIYVADSGTAQIVQFSILNSTQAIVLDGLTTPAGLAVDASGSLFVADSGEKTIVHLPNIGGALNKNLAVTLAPIVATPKAIAVDSLGNIYAADTVDATVGSMARTAGALKFGTLNVQTTSSTVSATVSDGGTLPLSFNTPYYTATGDSSSFDVQSSSTCTSGDTINPGSACSVAATFTPLSAGALSETLAFSSTAVNPSSLVLSGAGAQLEKTTLTLAITSTGTPTYGQPLTVSATVAAQNAGGPTPTGTVTFYLDTVAQSPVVLNGITASITFKNLTGGTHSITASYSGDTNYAYSASAALAISIAQSGTKTSISVSAPYTNPTAANPPSAANPQSIAFTATVSPALPGTPTGTVTFFNGSTSLGSATLAPAQIDGQSVEQATFTETSLPLGQYQISAVYSGDPNYLTSSSSTSVPLLISNPTIVMKSSATSITGGGSPITLTIGSIAGFNNIADLSCSGLPKYATCSFSPSFGTVSIATPAKVSFKVVINQPPVIVVPGSMIALPNRRGHSLVDLLTILAFLIPAALSGLLVEHVRRRGRTSLLTSTRSIALALLLLAGCSFALSGCGSTSGKVFATPSGTSTITVNAVISSTPVAVNPPSAQTLQLQLIVP